MFKTQLKVVFTVLIIHLVACRNKPNCMKTL